MIYREATISAFRMGILNAHIGILPKYRGRSVAQWSILQGDPTGVTVFFIDSGIDTGGRIVLREFIPSKGCNDVEALRNRLFSCADRLYRQALEALGRPEFQFERNNISAGKRYYVEVLRHCGTGPDHLAVAWQPPSGRIEVISGEFLSPLKPKK